MSGFGQTECNRVIEWSILFLESNLTDSQCERDFYVTTPIQGEKCYQNIMMMYYLPLFLNVDDVMSADPARGKLKCR